VIGADGRTAVATPEQAAVIPSARRPEVVASTPTRLARDPLLRASTRWRTGTELDFVALALGMLVALRGEASMGALTGMLLLAGYPIAVRSLLARRPATWEDGSLLDELRDLVTATSASALTLIGIDAVVARPADVPLGLRMWVFTLVLMIMGRAVLRRVRSTLPLAAGRPTLIVGAGRIGAELAKYLLAEPRHGLRPVGFLEYQAGSRRQRPRSVPIDLPLLGTPDELSETITRTGAECVVVAFPVSSDKRLLPFLEQCERLGVTTFVVPRLFEALGWRMRVRQVGSLPVGELAPLAPRDARFAVKHLLDRMIAALLLVALAPAILTVAVLIKAGSPGPVLFRQRRIGRDGREFTMLKLRTMYDRPGGRGWFEPLDGCAPGGVEDDDQRTPVGVWLRRASLDELPQLINVLRGEMSLVGPRPERPEYVRRFGAELRLYDRRHRVKSGITGLAQVSGLRGQTSIIERAEYDNFYVQNWSFWLDFKIALRTVNAILARAGE
jgi:exopolysaccharide biosynthesis polyprenyl glycosylphosphotransferase